MDLIASIKETISHADQWLDDIVNKLGWSKEHILQQREMIQCRSDPNHYVPKDVFEKHSELCKLTSLGYSRQEIQQENENDNRFFYKNSNTVITIELSDDTVKSILARAGVPHKDVTNRILPATMSHIDELSQEERLLLYQYCVDTAVAAKKPMTVPLEDLQLLEPNQSNDNRPKSVLELKAEERDMKRRRASYRGKSVHTANKSYTEVIRDVIKTQCELLQEKWRTEEGVREKHSHPSSSEETEKEIDHSRHKHKKHKKHKQHKSKKK